MLPEVVDKYFFANARTNPFEYRTALAICGQCAVRGACLVEAIAGKKPVVDRQEIRAGESGYAIAEIRRKYIVDGVPLRALVGQVLDEQASRRTVSDFPYLRQGRFGDVELIGETS